MTIDSSAIFRRAGVEIEKLYDAMKLLREFPDHIQAGQWRTEIANAKQNRMDVYYSARILITRENENRDELRAHPHQCSLCRGTGQRAAGARTILCSCPLAEAVSRGRTLEQDAYDRGISEVPPADHTQESLFKESA